jgi:putative ubiquitin-RnfH superfamily antitoxin RatB of RatAB toxin-antitoxin module
MRIEVAWAGPAAVVVREFEVGEGTRVADALRLAGQDPAFAGAVLTACPVGVFGRIVDRDAPLSAGDRVEVYRGPAADPKLARRARVARARRQEKGR